MRIIGIFFIGILFGIVLSKAEIISWYRIYEMFHFQSFHMYGVIGSAVIVGIISVFVLKKYNIKSFYGETLSLDSKEKTYKRYLVGGILFGMGWALVGVCPGPMFILLGYGYFSMLIVIVAALLGTFVYGIVKDKLPH